MIQTPQEFIAGLRAANLVAIVRGTSSIAATAAARALLEDGFRYIKVAMTTP